MDNKNIKATPQVQAALAVLAETSDWLAKAIGALEEHLTPVLSVNPEIDGRSDENNSVASKKVPVAENIEILTAHFRSLAYRVESITKRVEV